MVADDVPTTVARCRASTLARTSTRNPSVLSTPGATSSSLAQNRSASSTQSTSLLLASALMLPLDRQEKRLHLAGRLQMVNALGRGRIIDKLPVLRSQPAVTAPDHPVAAHRAAPHGAILRPALGVHEEALDEALGDPPVVRQKGQVNVHERVGGREPLPGRRGSAIAVDDPLISPDELGVGLQVLFVRDLAAPGPELDRIQRIER